MKRNVLTWFSFVHSYLRQTNSKIIADCARTDYRVGWFWIRYVHICTKFGPDEIYHWNLIYVIRACIAVAAIWWGLFACVGCRLQLSNITLHTKPLDEWCFSEIRCNAACARAFSLYQTTRPQSIADGAVHGSPSPVITRRSHLFTGFLLSALLFSL